MEKFLRLGWKSFNVARVRNPNRENIYVFMSHPSSGIGFPTSEICGKWYNSFLQECKTVSMFTHPTPSTPRPNIRSQVELLDTRSWRNLGLHPYFGFWKQQNFGHGIIIGVIDTGITPTHPSFNHTRVPLPPPKWKGTGYYNNKVIGQRSYDFSKTMLDEYGHGTHVSSVAGGNFVYDAHVLGQAKGTAAGMSPLCHLASYKICEGSFEYAIVDAVHDGVDVINISMASPNELFFFSDPIALGAFQAIRKGILVCCAAGNRGPQNATVRNCAPWILTVGACYIDRQIRAIVHLGNNHSFYGEAIFQPSSFPRKFFPVVYAKSDKVDLHGKIAFVESSGKKVQLDGAVAIILVNKEKYGYDTAPTAAYNFPSSRVNYMDGKEIQHYIDSTINPVAKIEFCGTIIGVDTPMDVAPFSSRGPSRIAHGIIKPDILAPGVGIVGADSSAKNNAQKLGFKMSSGTSQACPHVTGVVALVLKSHPGWSPAAVKSALMTTADIMKVSGEHLKDEQKHCANLTATGSGLVNPLKANDPGLLFDIHHDEYIPYLFGLGYTSTQVSRIVGKEVKTCVGVEGAHLNLPSFMIYLKVGEKKTFTRTVTNVGEPRSTYVMRIDSVQKDIKVDVVPEKLEFTALNQKITYTVCFQIKSDQLLETKEAFGSMTWISVKHSVRTPFHIVFVEPDFISVGSRSKTHGAASPAVIDEAADALD